MVWPSRWEVPQLSGHPHIEQKVVAHQDGFHYAITAYDRRIGRKDVEVVSRTAMQEDPNAIARTAYEQLRRMEDHYRKSLMSAQQEHWANSMLGSTANPAMSSAGMAGQAAMQQRQMQYPHPPRPASHIEDSLEYMRLAMQAGKVSMPKRLAPGAGRSEPPMELLDRAGPLAYLRARTEHFIRDVRLNNG